MGYSVTRSILLVAAVMGLVVSLASCTTETPGQAGGQQTTPVAGGQPTDGPFTGGNTPGKTTTKSNPAGGPMASVGPCTILKDSDLSSYGLGQGKEDLGIEGARECEYAKTGDYVMNVTIYDTQGVKDVTGRSDLKQIDVGGREAKQGVGGGGICAVALKVTDTSRVDVGVSARGNAQRACELVLPFAQLVEQKLP